MGADGLEHSLLIFDIWEVMREAEGAPVFGSKASVHKMHSDSTSTITRAAVCATGDVAYREVCGIATGMYDTETCTYIPIPRYLRVCSSSHTRSNGCSGTRMACCYLQACLSPLSRLSLRLSCSLLLTLRAVV